MADLIANNLKWMFITPNVSSTQPSSLQDGQFSHFIDVDLSAPVFEVPLFLMKYFCENISVMCGEGHVNHLVAPLLPMEWHSSFKSIPSILAKDVFRTNYANTRLVKVTLPKGNTVYYGTQGAIFDSDMTPLFMASWEVKRDTGSYDDYMDLSSPIIRVSAKNYLTKKPDAVQSFINNKIIKTFLECFVSTPSYYTAPYLRKGSGTCKPKVILEDIPFRITQVHAPSINTSQEMLKDTVIQNIDDWEDMTCL